LIFRIFVKNQGFLFSFLRAALGSQADGAGLGWTLLAEIPVVRCQRQARQRREGIDQEIRRTDNSFHALY
jgi:hypothetical protein